MTLRRDVREKVNPEEGFVPFRELCPRSRHSDDDDDDYGACRSMFTGRHPQATRGNIPYHSTTSLHHSLLARLCGGLAIFNLHENESEKYLYIRSYCS